MRPTLLICIVFFSLACKKNKTSTPAVPSYDSVFSYHLKVETNYFSTLLSNDRNVLMLANDKQFTPFIYKFSQSGGLLWKKTIAIPADTLFALPPLLNSMTEGADGSFLLCGKSYNKVPYNGSFVIGTDIVLIKTNNNGDVQWFKTFGGSDDDRGTAVIKTKDGNYLVIGQSESYSTDYYTNIHLVKVDVNGNTLWTKTFDIPDQQVVGDVIQTASGNIFLNATDNYGTGHANLLWLYIDANGNELWRKIEEVGTNAHAAAVAEATNGDFVVAYLTEKLNITRIDKNGTRLWTHSSYSKTGKMNFLFSYMSMKPSANNTFTMVSNSIVDSSTIMSTPMFLMKIDGSGKEVFFRTLPGDYINRPVNLLKADNGNNFITGTELPDPPSPNPNTNVFFIKTNDY